MNAYGLYNPNNKTSKDVIDLTFIVKGHKVIIIKRKTEDEIITTNDKFVAREDYKAALDIGYIPMNRPTYSDYHVDDFGRCVLTT